MYFSIHNSDFIKSGQMHNSTIRYLSQNLHIIASMGRKKVIRCVLIYIYIWSDKKYVFCRNTLIFL